MGYDIQAEGTFAVEAEFVDRAIASLLLAIEEAKAVSHNCASDPRTTHAASKFDPTTDPVGYINCFFRSGKIVLDSGDLCLHFGEDGDYIRHENWDWWLFDAIAKYAEKGSAIDFRGEDGHQWRWEITNGVLEEVVSGLVWGNDLRAPEVIEKVIALIYPSGQRCTLDPDLEFESAEDGLDSYGKLEDILNRVADVLREGGFGPEAGKTELERMADV
ncbi:MAG: hypothetical protein AB7L09_02180 [Nitrospira sp.]